MKANSNNIGHREFFNRGLKAAAATTLVSSVNPVSSAEASVTNEQIDLPGFIMDSHIHCGGTEKWVEDMVRIYKPYNAMACVLTWMKDMDLMVEAIQSYPDLFIGYGRVDLDGPNAWEHIVFGTDEAPEGLPGNIERFSRMLDANNVPQAIRNRMWGETMAENLGIDPETHRFIE